MSALHLFFLYLKIDVKYLRKKFIVHPYFISNTFFLLDKILFTYLFLLWKIVPKVLNKLQLIQVQQNKCDYG